MVVTVFFWIVIVAAVFGLFDAKRPPRIAGLVAVCIISLAILILRGKGVL